MIQDYRVGSDQEKKQDIIYDYFNGTLGTTAARPASLDLNFFHRSRLDLSMLEEPFLEDEVWATIKALPDDCAPLQDLMGILRADSINHVGK
jgi:hypothetical protein